jgi:ubiquinone/menaquinone biosynthesis C-methylase UbiE
LIVVINNKYGDCERYSPPQRSASRLLMSNGKARTRRDAEAAIEARGAATYAGFLLPHLGPDMTILDCGCGEATITLGLAELLPTAGVVGVDLDTHNLKVARCYASLMGTENTSWVAADGRRLPFPNRTFDAVLCHSMLETLDDPENAVTELKRVTKAGGVVGAASVEYAGIILGGNKTEGPLRFYEIRQQMWCTTGIANPNMGRRLRGLFHAVGFQRVEASAGYISYGTAEQVTAFARDRAFECMNEELRAILVREGIASCGELERLAKAWQEWGADPGAFFAFPWCRVLAWC